MTRRGFLGWLSSLFLNMPSATLRTNLELEYLFCPTSGQVVPDTSGNGRHGVLGLTSSIEPRDAVGPGFIVSDPDWVSNGVEFISDIAADQGDVITAPAGEAMENGQIEYTFEVWFASSEDDFGGVLIDFGREAQRLSTNWGGASAPNGTVQFLSKYKEDEFESTEDDILNGTYTVTPGLWTHIVGVRTSDKLLLYINGILDSETNLTIPGSEIALYHNAVHTHEDYRYIGADFFSGGIGFGIPIHNSYSGRIGELRVYSVALTALEVLFNYNASNYYPDGKNSCDVPMNRWYFF
jgi:hypothetical protein